MGNILLDWKFQAAEAQLERQRKQEARKYKKQARAALRPLQKKFRYAERDDAIRWMNEYATCVADQRRARYEAHLETKIQKQINVLKKSNKKWRRNGVPQSVINNLGKPLAYDCTSTLGRTLPWMTIILEKENLRRFSNYEPDDALDEVSSILIEKMVACIEQAELAGNEIIMSCTRTASKGYKFTFLDPFNHGFLVDTVCREASKYREALQYFDAQGKQFMMLEDGNFDYTPFEAGPALNNVRHLRPTG